MIDAGDLVISELVDGVQWLTLNRPDRLNAVVPELYEALGEQVAHAATDPAVRCVVLTGAGKGFCAGRDLKSGSAMDAVSPGAWMERRIDYLRRNAEIPRLLHDMPKPTIAMINGAAAGAGLSLAAACDFRIAGASAVLTSAFVKVGLPGDMGGIWFWSKILGTAKARQLYLKSDRFDAQSALEFGLVDDVVPDEGLQDSVAKLAAKFSSGSARAYRYAKSALNAAENSSLEAILDLEASSTAAAGIDAALEAGEISRS